MTSQVEFLGQAENLVHGAGVAVEMNGQQGPDAAAGLFVEERLGPPVVAAALFQELSSRSGSRLKVSRSTSRMTGLAPV